MSKPRVQRYYDSHERHHVWALTIDHLLCPGQYARYYFDTHAEAIAAASTLTHRYGMEATA